MRFQVILIFFCLGFFSTFLRSEESEPVQALLEPTVRNLFNANIVKGVDISRSGKYLAILQEYDQQDYIVIRDLETGDSRSIEAADDQDFGSLVTFGNTDKHLFYEQSNKRRGELFMYNIEPRTFTRIGGSFNMWKENPEQIIIRTRNEMGRPAVSHYNLKKRKSKRVQNVPTDTDAIFYDRKTGQPKVVVTTARRESGRSAKRETRGKESTFVLGADKKWEHLPFFDNLITSYKDVYGVKDPVALSPDGKTLYFTKLSSYGTRALCTYNLETKEEEYEVLVDPDFDVIPVSRTNDYGEVVRFSPKDGRLLGIRVNKLYHKTIWVDKLFASVQKTIDEILPKRNLNRISRWSNDERMFVIYSFSDVNLGMYYLFDRKEGTITPLQKKVPDIDESLLTKNMTLNIPLRDGTKMLAYLRLPHGIEKPKNMPCIVSIPSSLGNRYYWNEDNFFDQAFAHRGFAHLKLNVVGTPGFGRTHFESGFEKGGQRIAENIEDALDYLIEKGVVDAEKIGIESRGFACFFSMYAASIRPGFYKGLAFLSPITGLKEFYKDTMHLQRRLQRWTVLEELYETSKGLESTLGLKAIMDRVDSPVALFRLKAMPWSRFVSEEYAIELDRGLKKRGKHSESYRFIDETKDFDEKRYEGIIKTFETMIEFFREQLKVE